MIYVMISLEILIISIIIYNIIMVRELEFLGILLFSVLSRVIGLVLILNIIVNYGNDIVVF